MPPLFSSHSLAAPIIYVFFLLLLLVYLIVNRRSSHDSHAEMYHILRQLEEVLENDLSANERDSMLTRLQHITSQTDRPDVAELSSHISKFLQSETLTIVPERESWASRLLRGFRQVEAQLLTQKRARRILGILYLVNGLFSVFMLVILISLLTRTDLSEMELQQLIVDQANVNSATTLNWYVVLTALHLLTGFLIFCGALAFFLQRDRTAIGLGVVSLVITLTFINTLSFYFNQFSVLISSIYSFAALLALQRYRDRFLEQEMSQFSASP
jgi:ABC-type multidrug transport system fused ATPase/permease subunit